MRMEHLKVGDKLSVRKHHTMPFEFRTVSAVHKNAVVDDSGQKWTMRGYMWGTSTDRYGNVYACGYEPSHDRENEELERKYGEERRRRRIRDNAKWNKADRATLNKYISMMEEDGILEKTND